MSYGEYMESKQKLRWRALLAVSRGVHMKTHLELAQLFSTISNWDTIGVTARLIIGGLYGF
jgi:hypothetical protein